MDREEFPQSGRYEYRGLLGRGGMGVVYRAYDRTMQSEVALKTLPRADPDRVFHLKQEFRVVADLAHENLVRLHDLVMEDGRCFFTMELLEGVDIVDWVGVDPLGSAPLTPDSLELAACALGEIAAGVSAIHEAGMLHRDLKPANIRMRNEPERPRVVLLDFGIVSPILVDAQSRRDHEGLTGTPAYMSPEALAGGALGPPSDWYAVGCVAYEALTRRLPFERHDWRRTQVPAPGAIRPGVPAWLDDLIVALLNPDPAQRARGSDIQAILGSAAPAPNTTGAPSARHILPWGRTSGGDAAAPFVGRRAEIDQLSRAFAKLVDGASTVVHCHGDSGIGKSELLHRFAVRAENEADAVTLRGRCHRHESVPYKAVDQVVDDLTRYLLRESTPTAELVPEHADALCRLFPVLRRVPELDAQESTAGDADPHLIRRRGAAALRELLAAIGARVPLVVWIDDLQWGDEDGAALLREWLRPGAMPRFILALSYRNEPAGRVPLLDSLRGLPDSDSTAERIELALEPLGAHEAGELTSRLLAEHAADEEEVRQITHEAAGSPFFIGQLARHRADLAERGRDARIGAAVPPTRDGPLRLSDVIARRLDGLSRLGRRMVELASVAVVPLDAERALVAAGGGPSDRALLQSLEKLCLLRAGSDDAQPTIQTYHARIAEATVADLGEDRLRTTHATLVEVLREDPATEPEALVPHLVGAGDLAAAARTAAVAGDRAAEALAFDRAAQHYELALEHGGPDLDPHGLRVRLAEALVNAGQTPRAAEWFERAAEAREREDPHAPEVSTLRRRAAEHYLQSGLSDRGGALMRAVLGRLGLRLPESKRAALRSILWQRTRLRLRGTEPAPVNRDPTPETLARMDALWSAGRSNSMNSVILSGALVTRFLIQALDSGEPSRVIQGLGMEATWCSGMGGRMLRRVDPCLERIDALAEAHGGAYERSVSPYVRSVIAWTRGRYGEAAELMAQAIHILQTECRGTSYEVAVGNMYLLSSLAQSGELARLGALAREELAIAEERGNLFARNACVLGEQVLAWLVNDDDAEALRRAEDAVAAWSRGGFFTQHYHYLIATAQIFLYRGEPWLAWRRVLETWPAIEGDRILDMENAGVQMRFLRARAALCAAVDPAAPPVGLARWSPERLRRRARADARRIARADLPYAAAAAATLLGTIAAQTGDRTAARSAFEAAVAGFDASGMPVHREAARARLGACGEPDAEARAHAWLADQGVARPERLLSVFAPPVVG